MSSEEEDSESDDEVAIDYDSLPQVMLDDAHRKHVAALATKLHLPFNFISLLEICRITKVCQMVCAVYNWSAFPFCCLFRTCKKPVLQIPAVPRGKQPIHRQLPDFLGTHEYVSPEAWIQKLTNDVIDMVEYRFSNFPQAMDFTNVVLAMVTGSSTCLDDVLFTIHIAKSAVSTTVVFWPLLSFFMLIS